MSLKTFMDVDKCFKKCINKYSKDDRLNRTEYVAKTCRKKCELSRKLHHYSNFIKHHNL